MPNATACTRFFPFKIEYTKPAVKVSPQPIVFTTGTSTLGTVCKTPVSNTHESKRPLLITSLLPCSAYIFFANFLQSKVIQYQKGILLPFSFFMIFYFFVIFHKKVLIYLVRWTSVGLKLMSRKKPIIKAFYEVFLKFKLFIDNFSFCLSV